MESVTPPLSPRFPVHSVRPSMPRLGYPNSVHPAPIGHGPGSLTWRGQAVVRQLAPDKGPQDVSANSPPPLLSREGDSMLESTQTARKLTMSAPARPASGSRLPASSTPAPGFSRLPASTKPASRALTPASGFLPTGFRRPASRPHRTDCWFAPNKTKCATVNQVSQVCSLNRPSIGGECGSGRGHGLVCI